MSNLNKKISPDKKFYAEKRHTILAVAPRVGNGEEKTLDFIKYDLPAPEIFRWSNDSKAVGMITLKFAKNFAGVWFPFEGKFYQTDLPKRFKADSVEILTSENSIVCSFEGKIVKTVKMPLKTALTKWQEQEKELREIPAPTEKVEWIWNENSDGYEGVHLREGVVLWFQHSHNPHAGGAANEQSFEDFLENGAACFIPNEFLPELYSAVKKLPIK